MKKNVAAATKIIAAEEKTRIRVVELDLVGRFGRDDRDGRDDGDVTLAAGAEGSTAGTLAACGGGSCASGGAAGTLPDGTVLGRTVAGVTGAVGTLSGGSGPGGACSVGIWLLSAGDGFGMLRGGT